MKKPKAAPSAPAADAWRAELSAKELKEFERHNRGETVFGTEAKRKLRQKKPVVHPLLCPVCGEPDDVQIDLAAGKTQRYVEDCTVCCRPRTVTVDPDGLGGIMVALVHEDA
jgi:hypothetical protein